MAPSPVTHVSDTARWVAMYRAMESDRPDPLFRDPYAAKLAGTTGQEILRAMPKARRFAWPMVVRTAVMDEIITRLVNRDRADTVLNLAAGLDVRPYRLSLPPSLRWIETDFPDVLAYKRGHLAGERARCTLESVAADLTDASARRALFRQVGTNATRALAVSEGLLVYLTPDQVAELARDLHAEAAFRWWLIDLAAPRLLKMLERTWGKELRAGNAPLVFAPAQGTAFFEPHGWREAEFRSMWEESLRLGRSMPFARFWSFVGRFYPKRRQEEVRRMSGIVLLERKTG